MRLTIFLFSTIRLELLSIGRHTGLYVMLAFDCE